MTYSNLTVDALEQIAVMFDQRSSQEEDGLDVLML